LAAQTEQSSEKCFQEFHRIIFGIINEWKGVDHTGHNRVPGQAGDRSNFFGPKGEPSESKNIDGVKGKKGESTLGSFAQLVAAHCQDVHDGFGVSSCATPP
jgi:hypothetical protein